MNTFDLWEFGTLVSNLERLEALFKSAADDGHGGLYDKGRYQTAFGLIGQVLKYARSQGFACEMIIFASHSRLQHSKTADTSTLATELAHAWDALMQETMYHKFLRVSPERAKYVDQNDLFGPDVKTAFPSACADIREAGNCLAADCNTAAVFHMMRAVEWGLRALCVHLGFKKLRTRNRATGKTTYRLLEYTEWDTILSQLQDLVDRKFSKMRRGPTKQQDQEFYYPALQDIRGIRDAWRNHTMHTRREYTAQEADAILDHVRRLMVTLATRVAEI